MKLKHTHGPGCTGGLGADLLRSVRGAEYVGVRNGTLSNVNGTRLHRVRRLCVSSAGKKYFLSAPFFRVCAVVRSPFNIEI